MEPRHCMFSEDETTFQALDCLPAGTLDRTSQHLRLLRLRQSSSPRPRTRPSRRSRDGSLVALLHLLRTWPLRLLRHHQQVTQPSLHHSHSTSSSLETMAAAQRLSAISSQLTSPSRGLVQGEVAIITGVSRGSVTVTPLGGPAALSNSGDVG